jgi:hypothetical protein
MRSAHRLRRGVGRSETRQVIRPIGALSLKKAALPGWGRAEGHRERLPTGEESWRPWITRISIKHRSNVELRCGATWLSTSAPQAHLEKTIIGPLSMPLPPHRLFPKWHRRRPADQFDMPPRQRHASSRWRLFRPAPGSGRGQSKTHPAEHRRSALSNH